MRKFVKRLFTIILVIIIIASGLAFVYRDRLSLYISIITKYSNMKKPSQTLVNVSSQSTVPETSIDFKDVLYKNTNNVPLKLDIYSPKKKLKGGSPVILYVHGGSWMFGDKNIPPELSPILDSFREQGFTIISTSYELTTKNINFEKQVSDIKDTIRWINKNKDVYGFNSNAIGIIGVSSGAHLSLLASYSDNSQFVDDKDLSNYPCNVKYIIDLFGPTDLKTLDMNKAAVDFSKIINSTKDKTALMEKFSPINYVKGNLPSTLIIHSKLDTLVPFKNSTDLYDKCKTNGTKVELLTLEKSGHDLSNIDNDEVFSLASKVLNFIIKASNL